MVNSGFFIFSVAAFLVLYIFPTGRFLSRRWSWAGWLAAALSAEVFFVHFFLDEVVWPNSQARTGSPEPIRVHAVDLWYDGPLQVVFGIGLITLFVGVIPAVIARYLRSSELVRGPDQVGGVRCRSLGDRFRHQSLLSWRRGRFLDAQFRRPRLDPCLGGGSDCPVPAVRHRSDHLRTIGYAFVVVLLSAVYALGAVWLPTRLLGRQPPVFVAASTLMVVALFNRVRRPILARVDRRFYRSHYDLEQVIDSFTRQLRNETDTARLTQRLLIVVSEKLQPATIGVWVHTERDPGAAERRVLL